jgi:energy-coupling factor transporter ATP-binding protein EcfA2
MSAPGLKTLTIEHLRGSMVPFELSFEAGKKLTIVYGENGTGKSTICDAFEFLGNGKVGSLENRGLGKTTRYWPSLGKQLADVAVTLEMRDGTSCRANLVKSEVVAFPQEKRPRVEVLRRSQILSLVEAKPGDRYAAIRRFIDVSGVEVSEGALRELIRGLRGNREVAIARVQENQDSIQQFWESAGKPNLDPLAWADTESKRNPNASDAEISALIALQAAYARLGEHPDSLKSAKASVQLAQEVVVSAKKKCDDYIQTVAADAEQVMGVLESARSYLQLHPEPTACPLCESTESVQGLNQRINERLKAFSALRAAQSEVKTTRANLERSEQQLESLVNRIKKHLEDFEKLVIGFTWSSDIELPTTSLPKDIEELETWLDGTSHLTARWKNAEALRQDKKQFLNTLSLALKTYFDNFQAQKELDVLIPRLERTLEIVEEERRIFSDSILAEIATEVGRIYEEVHSGEGLNKISLLLDPEKRASLEISTSFCGQADTPPQAYFSESHLDTLGLCVFLALAGLDNPENTILVLDDVLASVDEPHVDRLIEMLYAQVSNFRHCVIATHYRPWKHKLQWGWLKNGQCQFVELARWTNLKGLTMIKTLPDLERLKKLLDDESPDPQLVCAKAGYIFEAALNFLTLLYECAVPRKSDDRYTIGDLLPSIKGKLRQNIRVDVFCKGDDGTERYETHSLTPIFDELSRIAEARNVFGCHFKAISFELLSEDALPFGRKVYELMILLTDPEKGWPKNSSSGEYWATAGETRRLYPLKKPAN